MAVMRKRPIDEANLENAPEVIVRELAKRRSSSAPAEKPFPSDAFNPMNIHWTHKPDPRPRHK
jgi:hypothetical protein